MGCRYIMGHSGRPIQDPRKGKSKMGSGVRFSHCLTNAFIPEPKIYYLWFVVAMYMFSLLFGNCR